MSEPYTVESQIAQSGTSRAPHFCSGFAKERP